MNLKINIIETKEGIVFIQPNGWLDNSVSFTFRKAVEKEIEEGKHNIIISLEKTKFIGEMGIYVLLYLRKAARERGGDLKLVYFSFPAPWIFNEEWLNKSFTVYKSAEEAIEKMEFTLPKEALEELKR